MKSITTILFAALLVSGSFFAAQAQKASGRLTVSTQLKETNGTYDQRQLYRQFLTNYMQECPYISHFSIYEAPGSSDNHEVVWSYEVNNWQDITEFYAWVNQQLKSKDDGLKKAMTPYQPDYTIGGQINVQKTKDARLARDSASGQASSTNHGG